MVTAFRISFAYHQAIQSGAMKKTARKKVPPAAKKKATKPVGKQLSENKRLMYGIAVEQQTLDDAVARGGRPRPNKLTVEKKTEFIRLLTEDGLTVVHAAEKIEISTVTLYEHRKNDAEFAAAWDQAWKDGCTVLEREAQRRAVLGTTEPVFYKGEVVGAVQKYSDLLLIFLMKARQPEKYREKIDLTNSDNSIANAFASAVRKAAS
jgi:hypothetical protein